MKCENKVILEESDQTEFEMSLIPVNSKPNKTAISDYGKHGNHCTAA